MEADLLRFEKEDNEANKPYLCDYMHLKRDSQGNVPGGMSKRRELYERIETTLKAYGK